MPQSPNKVKIPHPCSEDWDGMIPQGMGRHCGACNKTVIDFTTMSVEQMRDFFNRNYSSDMCGHMYLDQMDFSKKNNFQRYLIRKYKKVFLNMRPNGLRRAALGFLRGILLLTGKNPPSQCEIVEPLTTVTGDLYYPSDKINSN